ncbi:MAG: FAD-binding oxidoreductase [Myxococcales bacterium]
MTDSPQEGLPATPQLTRLSGWGANLRADCAYAEPETASEIAAQLDRHGTIARGLGRSYGDPALNANMQVIGTRKLDRYLDFDEATGVLKCEAGVSLERMIQDFLPRGWLPAITPGTRFVTVGGCIASDVHGKAHHSQGSFSACVDAMTVLLASGEVVNASREQNADLFWATFGGMGLLGVVLTATLRLRKVETAYFRQRSIRVRDLDELLAVLAEQDQHFPYSLATLDVLAHGAKLGRAVVTVGDHARQAELPPKLAREPLRVAPPPLLRMPFEAPVFNALTLPVLNGFIMHKLARKPPYDHYADFFYPLDIAHHWNRAYGRKGFTQYQFVIPFEDGARAMRMILDAIFSSGELPFLNVLKRLGRESGGILSFPREGYTFAIDFPIRATTEALVRRLDAMVLEAGGRIYLGKDSYVDAATFRAMYPAVENWLAIKAKYDPDGVFTSNLGRRVGLCPAAVPRHTD